MDSPGIPTTWSDICFQFYYYMRGNETQFVRIWQKYGNNSWRSNQDQIFPHTSPGWQYGHVQLTTVSSPNTLSIEGRVDNGNTGYTAMIAMDDMYISEGNCPDIQDPQSTSPSMESKIDVVCSDSYMTVYLDSSVINTNTDTVHFLDPACTAAPEYVYRKGIRWVYLYTRYDQCQTSMTSTLSSTTYHNQVTVSTSTHPDIYREDDHHIISVQCELDNRGRSSVSFAPEDAGETLFKRESGNFTFAMTLYTDGNYSTPHRQYPVELNLGSNVYVGASVQTFSNDMILFVDSCKATPNPDPDINPQYQLIENSCGVDSTVHFGGQSTVNKTSRVFFSFETFGFNGDYSTVFVHCQLSICNGSDGRCYRDCNQRRRRDISAPDKLSDTIPVVIGPVMLKRSDDDSDVILDTKDSTSKEMFPALSTTLLFAVSLVVLAVSCALWIKSRANKRNLYQKLENNMDEM